MESSHKAWPRAQGQVREEVATERENGMDVVFALADRISELNKGIVLENSTLEEIRSSAAVREAHLGS